MANTEKKILIVEDDEDFQDIYSLYLQGESYQIMKALNGDQGLKALQQEKPDLIILDLIMPVMDGETFYVNMRREKSWKAIPVLIASVNDQLPRAIEQLGGVNAVLRKPFDIDALLEKIRIILK